MTVHRHTARGASSVEYALIAALIAVVIITSVMWFGDSLSGLFERAGSSVSSAVHP